MATSKRSRRSERVRIGNVSLYRHRKSWWIYFRDGGVPQRRRVGENLDDAKAVAAQVNADLARNQPTLLSFHPVTVPQLAGRWLDYHEHVLRSSLGTVNRYRTAIEHLTRFIREVHPCQHAHHLQAEDFVRHLRAVQVAPNGHPHTAKRGLRDKGIKFILSACRSMFGYAQRQRLLPPYFENPFAQLRIERLPIDDAKAIHVFTDDEEQQFFAACTGWRFPVFYLLAKLGLRSAELTHLLIEDVDLSTGVLHIRNKPELGWQVKTRNVRSIPLPHEPMSLLRHLVGGRTAGVLVLRPRFRDDDPPLLTNMDRSQMAGALLERLATRQAELKRALTRAEHARLAVTVWRDAGAVKPTVLRVAFMKVTRQIGLPRVTCPKSWRHTFATTMQEAGVDPLIRQETMGHVPAGAGRSALGMTATYTHTQLEVHRQQLQRVIDLRPKTTEILNRRLSPDKEN